jgi:hypothetical protein
MRGRRLTLYRDDSTAQVAYSRVKSYFFTANNSVLTISRYDADDGDGHHYIHWPRERFCWFRDEPAPEANSKSDASPTRGVDRG